MEEDVITWQEKILDEGEFFVEGDKRPYTGWKEGGHGEVNMEKLSLSLQMFIFIILLMI